MQKFLGLVFIILGMIVFLQYVAPLLVPGVGPLLVPVSGLLVVLLAGLLLLGNSPIN